MIHTIKHPKINIYFEIETTFEESGLITRIIPKIVSKGTKISNSINNSYYDEYDEEGRGIGEIHYYTMEEIEKWKKFLFNTALSKNLLEISDEIKELVKLIIFNDEDLEIEKCKQVD